ncbi:MAG: aminotransferase class V-fold PLP-dependent enzyme, partial [Bacteroidales bacterium]|nr:aminotransferase class V-fold PLP-dependent enzyme [Bacteroidales bacterium]
MFEHLREEFPILSQQVHQKPLIYFDNAASTQKPISVINSVTDYYETINSNVHRGVHHLSQLATDAYEQARLQIQHFINAKHPHEVIFTRGTTESINLIACSFARELLKPGDEIILSMMEHHSNIVPWQLACDQSKAVIKVVPINEKGELIINEYRKLFSEKTKIVAITQTSNALGTINPIKEITDIAHANNVPV